jgi:ribosomal protein S27AE
MTREQKIAKINSQCKSCSNPKPASHKGSYQCAKCVEIESAKSKFYNW